MVSIQRSWKATFGKMSPFLVAFTGGPTRHATLREPTGVFSGFGYQGKVQMNVNRFNEFEAYASAVAHADLRLMLPRLDKPCWEVATQSVGRIDLQFGKEGSGIIADGAVHSGGKTVFVPLAGLQVGNGQPLHDHSVLVLNPRAELTVASREAHDWCSVFLPNDLFNLDESANAESSGASPDSQVIDIGSQATIRLRRLLASLERSLRLEPDLTSTSAIQKSIESELLAAFQFVVAGNDAPQPKMGRPCFPRREIIRRTVDKVEQHENESLSIEELVQEVGVSERTLRDIFLNYYGVPPQRYFTVKRLHQARAVLQDADPACTRVTAVAAEFGFWHFGRFARNYRRLFGEAPSQTLKKYG